MNMHLHSLTVNELFIPGCSQWDVELLEELFCERDVKQILSISLSNSCCDDVRVWHFDKKGRYLVKSGYRLAINLTGNSRPMGNQHWSNLWSLNIPPKVQHFVWRICRDCLPTRDNLTRRHIQVEICCVICRNHIENCWHLFVDCQFAQECMTAIGVDSYVKEWARTAESFEELMVKCLAHKDKGPISKFVMMLWSIWRQMNEILWNNAKKSLVGTVRIAECVLKEWLKFKCRNEAESATTIDRNMVQWTKPSNTWMKCNVDAAICCKKNATGIGMIIRDDVGVFVVARTFWVQGIYEVREAEALGVREALSWIRSLRLSKVVIETDAKYVVDGLLSSVMGDSEFDTILYECRKLLQGEPDLSVGFVRRGGNKVAHRLAKESFSFDSPFVWSDPPPCIVKLILDDVSY
ncbi:hypothetical protein DH2020_040011 [Rehmannia glutinosa]|uniref:Uncharacterized protein n=1 Tax=Rehmannia glutinosa TaxID=99300 RepID=A0ABR0UVD2_REHGL